MQGSKKVFRAGLDSGVNWGKSGVKVLVAMTGMVAVLLAFAAPASALPAICDEYPDLPVCSESTGGGGDGSGDDVGSAEASGGPDIPVGSDTTGGDNGSGADTGSTGSGSSASSAGGTGSGGELPFTGYPLTTLLLLMLLLLALGLAIRAGVAIHDRLGGRGREAASLPPPA